MTKKSVTAERPRRSRITTSWAFLETASSAALLASLLDASDVVFAIVRCRAQRLDTVLRQPDLKFGRAPLKHKVSRPAAARAFPPFDACYLYRIACPLDEQVVALRAVRVT